MIINVASSQKGTLRPQAPLKPTQSCLPKRRRVSSLVAQRSSQKPAVWRSCVPRPCSSAQACRYHQSEQSCWRCAVLPTTTGCVRPSVSCRSKASSVSGSGKLPILFPEGISDLKFVRKLHIVRQSNPRNYRSRVSCHSQATIPKPRLLSSGRVSACVDLPASLLLRLTKT